MTSRAIQTNGIGNVCTSHLNLGVSIAMIDDMARGNDRRRRIYQASMSRMDAELRDRIAARAEENGNGQD